MWLTGLVAPRHVGSSQTRARTRVPCIGRQILNHCATREAPLSCLDSTLTDPFSPLTPFLHLILHISGLLFIFWKLYTDCIFPIFKLLTSLFLIDLWELFIYYGRFFFFKSTIQVSLSSFSPSSLKMIINARQVFLFSCGPIYQPLSLFVFYIVSSIYLFI